LRGKAKAWYNYLAPKSITCFIISISLLVGHADGEEVRTTRTSSTSGMKKCMMEDMPMVSSKVEGPGGKKIDGFLYRYKKGGEGVRIVCVCHGSFLTPAEFVKHAGGGDVSNPLRHIVVNPAPSTFL
jgi:hypothetical protein